MINYKVSGATVSAAVLGIALVVLSIIVGEDTQVKALNVAVLVTASATGWLTGILVSPYDAKEGRAFPKYATAASAFVSGYLVSKLDRVLEEVLKPEILFSDVVAFRVLSGVAAFAVATVITYVYRAYAD